MVVPPMLFVRVRAARGWNVRVASRTPKNPWNRNHGYVIMEYHGKIAGHWLVSFLVNMLIF